MDCPKNPELFDEKDPTVLYILNALHDFRMFYRTFHKYISMILCLFGLVANCTHIWVLTRPRMLKSPVHTVLICIALADIGTMSSYAIYLLRYEFGANSSGGYSYGWVLLLKVHVVLSIALHAISLYLLVFMAYIRLRLIQTRRTRLFETRIPWIISLLIAIAIFMLCIPTLLAHDIQAQVRSSEISRSKTIFSTVSTALDPDPSPTKYSIGFSKMFIRNDCFLLKLNLWLIGIVLKVIPCMLLLCLTYCLLVKLDENKKKRMILLRDKAKDGAYRDRTTYMLLLMVAMFLCTELPQGIIAIFNAIYTAQFHFYVYLTIADVLDVLSLINCYVGFTVYFCTCSRYRQTFYSVLPHFRSENTKPQQPLERQHQGKRSRVLATSKELLDEYNEHHQAPGESTAGTATMMTISMTNGALENADYLL